ncbi:MAG: glycosyltransferase 87 family protein [Streptosporangiaceae bacterium]
MRVRLCLAVVSLAALTFSLLTFSRHGVGFHAYRLDLDVYRLGGLAFLRGENLYHGLPPTSSGVALPFTYPPFAAVLLSPLAMVPMTVASVVVTLASIALTAVTLREFTRSLSSGPLPAGRRSPIGPRLSIWWLLPVALFLEPVHSTLEYGQVDIALLALVSLDCLRPDPRWPRGALTGLAAAVKLTPAAFVLFFLLRRDWRAAATAAGSFAAATAAAFALDWHDSVQYWTHVIFDTSRAGNLAFAGNQSLPGLIARAGLDPQAHAGLIAWLALSAAVIVVTVLGMRRALSAADPAWALALNAFAGLLVSPISWTHHWVWAEPALLVLAVLATRHSSRAGLAAVAAGLVTFAVSPAWLLPSSHDAGLLWAVWKQVAGNSYVIFAAGALLLSAFGPLSDRGHPSAVPPAGTSGRGTGFAKLGETAPWLNPSFCEEQ